MTGEYTAEIFYPINQSINQLAAVASKFGNILHLTIKRKKNYLLPLKERRITYYLQDNCYYLWSEWVVELDEFQTIMPC